MSDIILATLNARYIHAAFGLRYLFANLGDLQHRARIEEFTISQWPIDIAEQLLAHKPRIIGLGVYIWNASQTGALAALLKQVAPEVTIVLGGPEVSYESNDQAIVQMADYVITGAGEASFRQLCRQILTGQKPPQKLIVGIAKPLDQLELPYLFYSDEDIRQRVVYVEASRGCPFKCEFCLSALDKTAKPFELGIFLQEMDKLYNRGLRHFKFVDRTFNLKVKTTISILEFFLQRLSDDLFLHFELIPDHLPDALKQVIQRFPPGSLQFEIGIQSFDPLVQALISRKQDNEASRHNLRWLKKESHAHLHTDLIFGLPRQDLDSFAESFDQLVELKPHEIQVGILKRLRGSPIIRHTEDYGMKYNPHPPYNILSTDRISFATMQDMNRFARYWDLVANSGHFRQTLPLLLGGKPFEQFMAFSKLLYRRAGQTHQIALKRLFQLVYEVMVDDQGLDRISVSQSLEVDFGFNKVKGLPEFLRVGDKSRLAAAAANNARSNRRQVRHLKSNQ